MLLNLIILFAVLISAGLYVYLSFNRPETAIITSLLVAMISVAVAAFMMLEEQYAHELPMCLGFAVVFPLTVLVLRFKKASYEESCRWPYGFSRLVTVLIKNFVILVFLYEFFNFFGLYLWAFWKMLNWSSCSSKRYTVDMDIISTIGSCIRQNLPLPAALEMAGDSLPDKSRKIIRHINIWLVQGYSLSESIKRGYRRCTPHIAASISAAESLGGLPRAFESIEAEIFENADELSKVRPIHPGYLLSVFATASLMTLGVMIFIIPKFAHVLDDLRERVALPHATQILVNISAFLLSGQGLLALVVISAPAVIYYSIIMFCKFIDMINGKPIKPRGGSISAACDFIKWHLPFYHWFEKNYSLIRITGILKVGLVAGHTVNVTLKEACQMDVNFCFKRRLIRWLGRVEQGDNISGAAIDCGVGKPIAWAFDDKVNAGNTPELLEMLQEFYRTNFIYKLNVARSIMLPMMIVLLGAVIGFLAFAMFMPLVEVLMILVESAVP